MGIYPKETWTLDRENGTATRRYDDYSGLVATEVYQMVLVIEERTGCFCCSCGETGHDPYCRNHGFAGERPCEEHGMPGQPNEEGRMPVSVQAARRANEELERLCRRRDE